MKIYIISQVFAIICYTLLSISYYAKNRKNVLIINLIAMIANTIAYTLLNAYTGIAMCLVEMIGNIVFLADRKKEDNTVNDVVILIALNAVIIVLTLFSYNGILSLLSVFGTILYIYSLWQKKEKTYKLLGIPIAILWTLYNIYVKSVVGIIFEIIILISSIIGYIKEIKELKDVKE